MHETGNQEPRPDGRPHSREYWSNHFGQPIFGLAELGGLKQTGFSVSGTPDEASQVTLGYSLAESPEYLYEIEVRTQEPEAVTINEKRVPSYLEQHLLEFVRNYVDNREGNYRHGEMAIIGDPLPLAVDGHELPTIRVRIGEFHAACAAVGHRYVTISAIESIPISAVVSDQT